MIYISLICVSRYMCAVLKNDIFEEVNESVLSFTENPSEGRIFQRT